MSLYWPFTVHDLLLFANEFVCVWDCQQPETAWKGGGGEGCSLSVQNNSGAAAQLMEVTGSTDLSPKTASRGGRRKCEPTPPLRETLWPADPILGIGRKGKADD